MASVLMAGMEETFRWYGPNDLVSLSDIRQSGATGIVSALHHVPAGEVWPVEEILERKKIIENAGLTWSVVESIPVHEQIKYGGPDRDRYIDAYKQSVRNMGKAGLDILCYNFMPVVDWTRTDLDFEWGDGSVALRFDRLEFAAFDLHMLKRPGAELEYTPDQLKQAKDCFDGMTEEKRKTLTYNIIRGLPGSMCDAIDSVDQFQKALDNYKGLKESEVQENLAYFLREVVPAAEEAGVFMAIHPDDPPIPLFGLPRVVSTSKHVRALLKAKPSKHNGLTMCVGSYASRADNNIPAMVEEFAQSISFVHLRNVELDARGSFTESDHLTGDVDMFKVLATLLREKNRRKSTGREDHRLPYRPDHGHKMMDDLRKPTNPGYPAVGRLRGLAELRGLEMGIIRSGILEQPSGKKRAAEMGDGISANKRPGALRAQS
jgi:mannonate dehydratase